MKRILVIALAASLLLGSYVSEAALASNSDKSTLLMQTHSDRKEARKLRKENRKARRQEYMNRTGSDMKVKQERVRITRENYRQRKKMDKATRKQSRKQNWGGNHMGDVFQVY